MSAMGAATRWRPSFNRRTATTSSETRSTAPVSSAYCTSRWLVRGIGAELATNLARRGGKQWRTLLRKGSRRTPPSADGALAVVTGATGGLGAEICTGLASLGYEVIGVHAPVCTITTRPQTSLRTLVPHKVVVAARDPTRGEALARELRAGGSKSRFVRWDATDLKH